VLRRRSARARSVDFAFGPRILAPRPDPVPASGEREIAASFSAWRIHFCGIAPRPFDENGGYLSRKSYWN
jgi:hypothetical protein